MGLFIISIKLPRTYKLIDRQTLPLPMPRDAPVTSATRPARGDAESCCIRMVDLLAAAATAACAGAGIDSGAR